MEKLEFEQRNLARLVGEYIDNTECDCGSGVTCWRCILKFSLEHLDAEINRIAIASEKA